MTRRQNSPRRGTAGVGSASHRPGPEEPPAKKSDNAVSRHSGPSKALAGAVVTAQLRGMGPATGVEVAFASIWGGDDKPYISAYGSEGPSAGDVGNGVTVTPGVRWEFSARRKCSPLPAHELLWGMIPSWLWRRTGVCAGDY
jgi:hypothetical protein